MMLKYIKKKQTQRFEKGSVHYSGYFLHVAFPDVGNNIVLYILLTFLV